MSAFSYTSEQFTKEEEERELADLTSEEKESILDDFFGRNLPDVVNDDYVNTQCRGENDDYDVIRREEEDYLRNGDSSEESLSSSSSSHNDDNNSDFGHDNVRKQKRYIMDSKFDVYIDDSEDDITDEMLKNFIVAMDKLPVDDKSAYLEALVRNESLFETECHPKYFLRTEDYDADKAARRMTIYWQVRKYIFGDDRAFLPLTFKGAMADDLDDWKLIPNLCRLLPNDSKGRTVLCYDRNGITDFSNLAPNIQVRICFYVAHIATIRRSTQINGFVGLSILKIAKLSDFYRIPAKLMAKSTIGAPYKCSCHHVIPSHAYKRFFEPVAKKFLTSKRQRTRVRWHLPGQAKAEYLFDLNEYGLFQKNLPSSIGGHVEPLTSDWIDEQLRKEEEDM